MEENINNPSLLEQPEADLPVETEQEEIVEHPKRSRRWLWVAGVVGVLLFVAAAFLGGRLLAGQPLNPFGSGPLMAFGNGKGGMHMQKNVELNVKPAKEIPERKPEVMGIIAEIKDNALMIGTNPKVMAVAKDGEDPKVSWTSDDPLSEVVITNQTLVYVDTTFDERKPEDPVPDDGTEYQQTVEEIAFSDLEKENFVRVWGYRRGDRVIAEVLLYHKPVVIRKAN